MNLPYNLTGKVIHGKHLGSTVNMPTANIVPREDIVSLAKGVYYSDVTVDDKVYKGITNIGTKPTVKDDQTINAETYIFDFDEDIYGKEICVTLLGFRRPEQKFDSFEQLSKVIAEDIEARKQI